MSTTYLITGANRGIGYEFVKVLSLRPNTKVIATSRSDSKQLTDLVSANGNISVLKLSVDDASSIAAFGKELAKLNVKIDYFISNAGIADSYAKVAETERQSWIDHWTVNTLGPVEVLKVVKPHLAPKNKLIFISTLAASISGFDNFPISVSAYGSSKLALNYVVKELSFELKDSSIVIAMSPGVVSTDMGKYGSGELSKQLGFEVPSITAEESVAGQLKVFDNLKDTDNGKFYSYDATEMLW